MAPGVRGLKGEPPGWLAERRVMVRSIPRPSPALVIACLALVVALSGTSYADVLNVPSNSVGTRQLRANAVVSSKVKNRSLLAIDFAAGQLGIKGYEMVRGQSEVTDQTFNSVSIECPIGKNAVGGGGGTGGGIIEGDGPYVVVSQPFEGGGGWLIQTARKTPGASVLVGYAICADVS
jgi:hypothetical protein